MMRYYVDGYNLLFHVLSADQKELHVQRQQIIQELNQKASLLDLDLVVIFDAQYQVGESSRSHYDRLEILFTSQDETADETILEMVRDELSPSTITVVTSDKKLAWFARRCSAKTETVQEFINWLNRRYRNRLKQQKRPPAILKVASSSPKSECVKSISASPSVPKVPTGDATAADCYEYYLKSFETEFEKLSEQEKSQKNSRKQLKKGGASPTKTPRKKDKIEAETEGDKSLSDARRWIRAFERDVSKDE